MTLTSDASGRQVHREYYTMTASGVVYVPGDPTFETEFIPIGEWLRETSIYNLMRTLRFFKYYFTQKMFRIWRKVRVHEADAARENTCAGHVPGGAVWQGTASPGKRHRSPHAPSPVACSTRCLAEEALRRFPQNAQSTRYERVRQKLEGRMFLAKPDFCRCIMDVKGLLFDLSQTELILIGTDKSHVLNELVSPRPQTGEAARDRCCCVHLAGPHHGGPVARLRSKPSIENQECCQAWSD